MTEKNFNYTLRYYLFQMGRLKTLTVFSCLFAVIGFPLLSVAYNLSLWKTELDYISVPMYVISVIGVIGMAILSFITPIVAFKHLYTKTSADNILSLPLTTTQRFIGDIGAILTSYSLPLLISAGITAITENTLITVCKIWADDFRFFMYAIMAFLATLQFIFLNSAIITCCGRLAETILYPVAVNVIMPLAVVYGGELAFLNAFGISSGNMDVMQSPVFNMWPLGYLLNLNSWTAYAPISIICSVIYLALTYLGYRNRRAENIGKPFVFKYSFLITTVVVGIAFIICYAYLADMVYLYDHPFLQTGTVVAMAVILLIMLLIMEVINYKKIHNILKFILHYAGTLGGGLLLCLLLLNSKGFGMGYYVPSVNQVDNVYINTFTRETSWENGVDNGLHVTGDEGKALVCELHKYIIDNVKEHNDDIYDPYLSVTNEGYNVFNNHFSYEMKNGTYVGRNYSTGILNPDIWEKLYQTEDYRVHEIFSLRYHDYYRDQPAQVRFVNRHSKEVYMEFLQEEIGTSELLKAVEKDLRADTEFGRHDENTIGVLCIGHAYAEKDGTFSLNSSENYYSNFDIPIYESYVNTISILSQHGTVPTIEKATEDSVKNCEVFMLYRVKTGGIDMAAQHILGSDEGSSAIFITADEFKELTSKQVGYNIFDGEDTSDDYQYTLVRGAWYMLDQVKDKEEMIEALEKDGIDIGSYDIFDDYTGSLFERTHVNDAINTEYNAYCDQLFEERTQLIYSINPEDIELRGYDIVVEK